MSGQDFDRGTPDCVPVEELGAVSEWAASDPRRAHVEACPRCAALATELQAFLTEAEPLPGQDDAAAEHALRSTLHRELFPADSGRAGTPLPIDDPGDSWWRRWFGAGWRPAWAFVALLLVVVSVTLLWQPRDEGSDIVLRGSSDRASRWSGEAVAELRAGEAESGISFRWSPQERATVYRVEIYTANLAVIAEVDAGADTTCRWAALGDAGSREPAAVFWRVMALEDGDVVGQSQPQRLPVPEP